MGRYLKLHKQQIAIYTEGRTLGFRLVVGVVEAGGMPKEVFIFQRKTGFGVSPITDVFQNLASASDLEEYPVGSPDPSQPLRPFFRAAQVDLVFRSMSLMADAWRLIINDLSQLVETLNLMDNLTPAEEVTIGTPPSSSSSSHPSPSSSSSSRPSSSSSSPSRSSLSSSSSSPSIPSSSSP